MATILGRSQKDGVMDLSLADGIKELLYKYHLSKPDILSLSADQLASLLEIDEYIAKLILIAAKTEPKATTIEF